MSSLNPVITFAHPLPYRQRRIGKNLVTAWCVCIITRVSFSFCLRICIFRWCWMRFWIRFRVSWVWFWVIWFSPWGESWFFRRSIIFRSFSCCASFTSPVIFLLAHRSAPTYPVLTHTACSYRRPDSTNPCSAANHSVWSINYRCSVHIFSLVWIKIASITSFLQKINCSGFLVWCFMTGTRLKAF